ncbi:MAG: phosphomethylpyrimidine synthase ThiC [Planctomycetota bacterium]
MIHSRSDSNDRAGAPARRADIDLAGASDDEFLAALPMHGASNPSSDRSGTTPGSFALAPDIGGPLTYASPDTPGMPPPSEKTAWDFLPRGAALDPDAPAPACLRASVPSPSTQLEHARLGTVTDEMQRVAAREPHLTPEQVRDEVGSGRMIIPANIVHLGYKLDPMCIGRASTTKINANMGASPVSSSMDEEVEKLRWAERWGADTVMDLSTGGDLDACREAIIRASTVPIGTVPIYSMIIGRRLEDLDASIILAEIEKQAKQGVSYMTIHAAVRRGHLKFVKNRLIGIVSRGGSLLAKWMLMHDRENPMYDLWDDICDICRQYDVSFSIGDGLRPGGLADATDRAQLAELETVAELTERAWSRGVQVMCEGPGHVPLDQVEYNMKLQRRKCHGAPFYVLGPLVTDIFPGYDHITSCIGATSAAWHGASMLCYVTPKEHLGLPKKDDVKQGCIAYKIAAHAADVALGIPGTRDRDDDLTKARAALNWEKHFELSFDPDTARALHDEDLDVDTDFCAMCGHDWCSVRISREIQEFASGKDDDYQWDKPRKTESLTAEQQAILEQRGYLSPEEIHLLANKVKRAMAVEGGHEGTDMGRHEGTEAPRHEGGGDEDASPTPHPASRPSCHSDYVDPETAKRIQAARVGDDADIVQLDTSEAHNLPKHDPVI